MKIYRKILLGLLMAGTVFPVQCFGVEWEDIVNKNNINWKQELMSLCIKVKERIENSPDERLICSCIAIAHFDGIMAEIKKSDAVTQKLKDKLQLAFKAKADFKKDRCPPLAMGVNKIRFRRFKNSRLEEFVVAVPRDFNPQKAVSVLIHPDNRRWALRDNRYYSRDGFIDIWWNSVEDKEIKWKNFDSFMEILGQLANIDFDRIYLKARCGNAIAAMSMALTRPDYWAQCRLSLGNAYRYLAGNAYNLNLLFVRGNHQEKFLKGYYDFAVKCLKHYKCKFFKYDNNMVLKGTTDKNIFTGKRAKKIARVIFTMDGYGCNRAYWCEIIGKEDDNFTATIDANVCRQKIFITTKNIAAYGLNLTKAPIDIRQPYEIIENGRKLGKFTGREFVRKSEKNNNAKYTKNKKVHGPVKNVFTDRYIFVVGKDGNQAKSVYKNIAEKIINPASIPVGREKQPKHFLTPTGPIDIEIAIDANDEMMRNSNIIFIGTIKDNNTLEKIIDKLPVKIDNDKLMVDGDTFKKAGVIFIHPNPENPEKSIAVFTGTDIEIIKKSVQAYSKIKDKKNVDIAVYKINSSGKIKLVMTDGFNSVWEFHKSRKKVLAELKDEYPIWKLKQLTARAVRSETKSDCAIIEEAFADYNNFNGNITERDVYSHIKNDLIVKVSIKGSELKKIMMTPFNNILKREVKAPIIDGFSFVKYDKNNSQRCINEIKDNKNYSLAISERIINGQRMGKNINEYKITGFYWQSKLVRDYLKHCQDVNLELSEIKLNIF